VLRVNNEEVSTHIFRIFRSMLHGFAVLESEDIFGYPVSDSVNLGIEIVLQGIHSILDGEGK
jgi:hypothetical protein